MIVDDDFLTYCLAIVVAPPSCNASYAPPCYGVTMLMPQQLGCQWDATISNQVLLCFSIRAVLPYF